MMPAQFLWTNLVNILVLSCLSSGLLLTGYCQSEGLNRWQIGLIGGAFSLAALLTRIRLGPWLGQLGLPPLIRGGSLLAGLCVLAYATLKPAFPLFAILRILEGLAIAAYFTAIWTRVVETSPPQRLSHFSGLFGVSGLLAGSGGPFLLEQLQLRWGYPAALGFAAGLGLLGALLSFALPALPPKAGSQPSNPGLWAFLSRPQGRPALLAALVFGLGMGTLNTFISPFLLTTEAGRLGTFFLVYTTASIVVRLRLGSLADRHPPARVIVPSLLLLALGLGFLSALAYFRWPGAYLSVAIAIGSAHGLFFPAVSTLALRSSQDFASSGSATAAFTACIDLGVLLGASLMGVLAHSFGYTFGFGLLALFLVLGTARFWNLTLLQKP